MRLKWRYLDLSTQSNTRLLDVTIGWDREHCSIRIMRDVPVDMPNRTLPMFVKKSTYEPIYIVHPNGGGANRLRCTECGADYLAPTKMVPCSNCAVMKQSGVEIRLGRWKRDWLWSNHGWAVKTGEDSWLLDPNARNGSAQRFRHKNDALDAAKSMEEEAWVSDRDYRISVEPYPEPSR
jgi:hypothetical protein